MTACDVSDDESRGGPVRGMGSDELQRSCALVADGLWIGGGRAEIPASVRLVITLEASTRSTTRCREVRSHFEDSRWVRVDRDAVLAAVDAADTDVPVLIRCRHGLNRSGLVAALVLRRQGLTAESALTNVRAGRPGALGNPYFVDLVVAWPRDPMVEVGAGGTRPCR